VRKARARHMLARLGAARRARERPQEDVGRAKRSAAEGEAGEVVLRGIGRHSREPLNEAHWSGTTDGAQRDVDSSQPLAPLLD
jgi:hypothetical protein